MHEITALVDISKLFFFITYLSARCSNIYFHFHLFFNYRAILFIFNNELFCFRPLLKQIKNSAESHIVLDCSTERIYDVLKQAQQIGMMSDYHSYLITSLVGI